MRPTELALTTQHVILKPHDPRWASEFARESAVLASALGGAISVIHHVGSTAILGIHAKPIIDMLAVTEDLSFLDESTTPITNLGYEALGEFGISGRRYFRKDNSAGERTHQIHAFQIGSAQITRHLAFRDYLLAHPTVAHDYDMLKHRLTAKFPKDIRSYTNGKDSFIKDIDSHAAAWISKDPHRTDSFQ